ncbi:hypothetical protein SPRG_09729 [Saprolegnia parasitica CBS 223.65]|uniref:F-box domain-containing protein n=1 Tax=Saprolegnia parasitica (strain CBS 223.65) TaxID=695850 RepID=A0A067C2I3_SAPPC|nr:hypothetical protein SPRG_09729 [Saprolegnia parasitica CBS 223.65]KDO24999.1 hypothetical protein SPRG_09729 [Saprolegnia parasitica CBS 223.65]|eukprot:XP_012204268.1 hypothetical protein SPRG_09729 [Saprolegnia parasitica CBS 223.65]
MGLARLHDDFLAQICAACTVADLGALVAVSKSFERLFRPYFIDACKRYCFLDYLTPSIAAYRMASPVPRTWPALYKAFTSSRHMSWSACASEVSSGLRKLKVDPTEYAVDGAYLLRCGGHYLFSLWQIPLASIHITSSNDDDPRFGTLDMATWEKVRPVGAGPCPRRNHSITALPPLFVARSIVCGDDNEFANQHWRRLIVFGGQAETYPFQAFNDLYLCCQTRDRATGKTKAYWVEPETTGVPPSPRSSHVATVLDPMTVLFSGGSSGTTAIPNLEIFLLHQIAHDYGDMGLGAFRWSQPTAEMVSPMGRTLHAVLQPNRAKRELIIFGGKQIRESNGLFDCHCLTFLDANLTEMAWSKPTLCGPRPSDRRGHSTTLIGQRHLLVFGGQDSATHELENTTYELDAMQLRWSTPTIRGRPPSPRRGHKMQFFGSRMVVQSGFTWNECHSVANTKLPETDAHVLSFLPVVESTSSLT